MFYKSSVSCRAAAAGWCGRGGCRGSRTLVAEQFGRLAVVRHQQIEIAVVVDVGGIQPAANAVGAEAGSSGSADLGHGLPFDRPGQDRVPAGGRSFRTGAGLRIAKPAREEPDVAFPQHLGRLSFARRISRR
jgi:hypothetical protein